MEGNEIGIASDRLLESANGLVVVTGEVERNAVEVEDLEIVRRLREIRTELLGSPGVIADLHLQESGCPPCRSEVRGRLQQTVVLCRRGCGIADDLAESRQTHHRFRLIRRELQSPSIGGRGSRELIAPAVRVTQPDQNGGIFRVRAGRRLGETDRLRGVLVESRGNRRRGLANGVRRLLSRRGGSTQGQQQSRNEKGGHF